MAAVLLLTLFSVLMAILGNIFVTGSMNPTEMTALRTQQTQEFFQNIDRVVESDITTNNMQAATPQDIAAKVSVTDYIQSHEKLAMMGNANFRSPAVDAWGHPIQGVIRQENMVIYSGNDSTVLAPVTAFALISQGADSTLNQDLQDALTNAQNAPDVGAVTTVMSLAGHKAGQAIVYTFNDLTTQRKAFENVKNLADQIMKVIKSAHQQDVTIAVAANSSLDPTQIPMPDVSAKYLRQTLGIQSMVDEIQKPMANGGSLEVRFSRSADLLTLTMTITNSSNPTPWTTFTYVSSAKSGG